MMLAMCSAPLHVRLQPVKSTVLMHVVYFTLWQMTKEGRKKRQFLLPLADHSARVCR